MNPVPMNSVVTAPAEAQPVVANRPMPGRPMAGRAMTRLAPPRRGRGAPPRRRSGSLAPAALGLAALLLLGAAGCALNRSEPVEGAPPGSTVLRMTGLRPASAPPDPRTAAPSSLELEASLRRLMVRYTRFTAAFRTEARPLLTDDQIFYFARILARDLPTLTDKQRLRFRFADRYFGKGFNTEMDVYREGSFLVYWFNALAVSSTSSSLNGDVSFFPAVMEQAAPGQIVGNRDTVAYVKDPLLGEEREAAAALAAKAALLGAAREDRVVTQEEAAPLEALMQKLEPSLEAWKAYWERRRTLKKALDQGLVDAAAYQVQLSRLDAELRK